MGWMHNEQVESERPTMKREIEFEGIPEGYEPVRFGHVYDGESYMDYRSRVVTYRKTELRNESFENYLVVRPIYQFPDFIPDGWWIAMDSGGRWYAYEREPSVQDTLWGPEGEIALDLTDLNWTPPEVSDWKSSKMRKPNDQPTNPE